MLKNVRKASATLINWESNMVVDAVVKKNIGTGSCYIKNRSWR